MTDHPGIITLTTDFGLGSPYVAQMKAVILSIEPRATIVDVTHAIAAQNIRHGALVLEDHTHCFPAGSIHVAVVDPSVGSARDLLAVQIDDHFLVGPDNGLFSRLVVAKRPTRIVAITNRRFWRKPVSHTFHGRDIMAPVAAHLARGVPIDELGEDLSAIEMLDWAHPQISEREIRGEIWYADSFGNLITNITRRDLDHVAINEKPILSCADHQTSILADFYGQHEAGTLVGLLGSNRRLELAVVNGSAATRIGAAAGCPVSIRW